MYRAIVSILEKWGCHHKWDLYHETEVYNSSSSSGQMPVKRRHTFICKKCGKFKKINV